MIEDDELIDEFDELEETEDGTLFEHYNLVVDPGQTLLRIDKFLSDRLKNATRSRLQAAADMLKPDGRLVAILPASAKGKDLLPGWSMEWARTFDNEFAGTSVSVVVLIAQRNA